MRVKKLASSSAVQEKQPDEPSKKVTPTILTGSALEAQTIYKSPVFADSYIFPFNPDPLVSGNDYSIYKEMMNDDQVKAAISLKKDMVINTGWKIECENDEIKEFVEAAFKRINEGLTVDMSFEDSLRDILSSYEFGFSLTEPVYGLEEEGEYQGKYIYKCLKTRPPDTFRFNIDDKGNVTSISQVQNMGEKQFKPSMFIHHVYQQEFGNPYGRSDLSAAHDHWKAKKFVMRFMAMYLERFAQPTVAGEYPTTMDSNEINAFHTMLKSIQSHTTLAFPQGTKIDLLYPQRDGSDSYIKAVDLYNMMIARSILVPDLLGIGGAQTKGGSLALGKEHFKTFLGTIYKDRQALERKITLKLVKPLIEVNFGKSDVPVEFKFVEYTEDDVSAYADLWVKAVSAKIFKPNPEEINHFRSITGFPEGDVMEFPEPTEFGPDGKPIKPNEPPKTPFDKNGKRVEEPEGEKKPKKDEGKYALKTFREKTAFEKKVDFVEMKRTLDESEDTVFQALRRTAKMVFGDFIDQIRDKGLIRNFRPEKMNEIQPRHMKEMNLVFRNHFRQLFRDSIDEARREIFPNGVKTSKFSDALLPEEFEEIIAAESFKVVGDYATHITKKGKNVLVEGIKSGQSEADIVRAIRDLAVDETESWLATVVRTKTTEIYNEARRSYWENDEFASQLVEAYQFSAIMDNRTSDVCAELDGKIFSLEDEVARITPPLHFNCRSVLVPITKFEEYKAEKVPAVDRIQELGGGLKNFAKEG